MRVISTLINFIDRFTEVTGRAVSWLTILMVGLVVAVVVMRYFLDTGSIALQELVTYLHATVFMLGIAFTLKRGGHVRVDIFYRQLSAQKKALVDVLGGLLFLIPVTGLVFVTSWDYVMASWAIAETSAENTGLPYIYLLKTLMLLMPIALLLQGIAEVLKSALTLAGLAHSDGSSFESDGSESSSIEPIL